MARPGMKMIEMYVMMVDDEFGPILRRITMQTQTQREAVTRQVRLDLGIYELHVEKVKIEARLVEINEQLNIHEKEHHIPGVGYTSRLSQIVDDEMKKSQNGVIKEVMQARNDAVKNIRLSGVTQDVGVVFRKLPEIIEKLEAKLDGKFIE